MKKIMLSSIVVCVLLVSCFLLSACRLPEFMGYRDVVWYSEDLKIEIFMTDEKWQEGIANSGTETTEIQMAWGAGGQISFWPLDVEITSDKNRLFQGEWVWDKRAKTLTITVIDDKIWNNDYPTIVLRYRDV